MAPRPDKEVVLDATGPEATAEVLERAKRAGIRKVVTRGPAAAVPPVEGMEVVTVPQGGEEGGPETAAWVEVTGAKDVAAAVAAAGQGHAFVVVQPANWKIIPLENLIADFHRSGRRLYAYMKTDAEMEMAFSILEKGVDGIVVPVEALEPAARIVAGLGRDDRFSLTVAKVTRMVDVGTGERACIDTASQLAVGEGLLVGSRASFFFLVHSETVPSEYIPTREFRVNAGAIHSYVLGEDDKTRYLSELRSSDRVRTVRSDGGSRQVIVGRVKIERRPLMMVEAQARDGELGTVMVQKAETIRLMRPDGSPVSVTEIKLGDEVLVHLTQSKARHFGGEVDEFILER
ncbi:MAG: 3-dehydroquinate synthase II [Nitrososphaerales archaeon]|jgi:3-dehydroquinate synthase II